MGGGTTNQLPPGFLFFPSDEELVVHFLYCKASLLPSRPDVIPTITDLHEYAPWDLINGKALQGGNNSWYFFTRRSTQNRASVNGYWSVVDADEIVSSSNSDVGVKKTLKYYIGEPVEGIRTSWVMHEYHFLDGILNVSYSSGGRKRAKPEHFNKWVICRVHESAGSSRVSFQDNDDSGGTELLSLDEVFLF